MKTNNIFNNKKFKHGSMATMLTAVFLVAVILVNVVSSLLIDRFDLKIDLTKEQIHEMSTQTTDFLAAYQEKTTIYVLADEETFKTASPEYTQAYNIIQKYAKHNSNITTEYINLSESPDFTNKFPKAQFATGDVVVSGENGRYKQLSATDLFQQSYDQTTYQVTETLSTVEQSIATALEYVAGANPAHAVMISGHSENELQGLIPVLEKNNYECASVSLLTGSIDQASDMVVIACPTVDYTVEEITALETYLNNDGKLGKSVVYLAAATQPQLPNLEAFLAKWGIGIKTGLVLEMDKNLIYQSPIAPFVSVGDSPYTAKMTNRTLQVLAPYLKPMSEITPTNTNVTTTSIMKTSGTTVFQSADAAEDWTPTQDDLMSYQVAMAGVQTSGNTSSSVVALASISLLDYISEPTLNNGDFALNLFNTTANKQSAVQVLPKTLTPTQLNISVLQATVLMAVFMILIPLAVLIFGVIIWLRRRNQ